MKHLKRKNAELAVIAKRLEERARKLQEANLKVVSAAGSWAGEHHQDVSLATSIELKGLFFQFFLNLQQTRFAHQQ